MCGRCVLGCPRGIKWDSRTLLARAVERGATLRTGVAAVRVVVRGGEAVGLEVRTGLRRGFVPADLVVLAAGGFGTPPLLERSGIPLRAQAVRRPRVVRHGDARGRASGSRPSHAVLCPEGRIHHIPLFRSPELFLQPRLAAPGRGHPEPDDQARGRARRQGRRRPCLQALDRQGHGPPGRGRGVCAGRSSRVSAFARTASSSGRSTRAIPAVCSAARSGRRRDRSTTRDFRATSMSRTRRSSPMPSEPRRS